jgi:hypothetical protein
MNLMIDPMSFIFNSGTIITTRKTKQVKMVSIVSSLFVISALMFLTQIDFMSQAYNMRNMLSL